MTKLLDLAPRIGHPRKRWTDGDENEIRTYRYTECRIGRVRR